MASSHLVAPNAGHSGTLVASPYQQSCRGHDGGALQHREQRGQRCCAGSTESSVASASLLAARWGLGTVPTAPDAEGDELNCTVTTAHGLAVQDVDNLKLC
jgi:hypothetical protein